LLGRRISSSISRTWISWQRWSNKTRRILCSKSSCWTITSLKTYSSTVCYSCCFFEIDHRI